MKSLARQEEKKEEEEEKDWASERENEWVFMSRDIQLRLDHCVTVHWERPGGLRLHGNTSAQCVTAVYQITAAIRSASNKSPDLDILWEM